MAVSRRQVVMGGFCGCLGCLTGRSWAKPLSTSLEPLVSKGYAPADVDERGLWQSCERLEEDLATSDTLFDAPDFHAYSMMVLESLLGPQASDVRMYLVHEPSFNASMFPTGMMLVHTGFIVRARSEAQFAAVLGHESGHYLRKHSLEGYRDRRWKSAAINFVAAGGNLAAGATAVAGYSGAQSWIDLANSINQALLLSVFNFSREQESEADAYGSKLLATAGYSPRAASEVWGQLIAERRLSAQQRNKRFKDDSVSAYSTHPPTDDRMEDLADTAAVYARSAPAGGFTEGGESWAKAINPYLSVLLAEQVKLNDPGASFYMIQGLAGGGWTGVLRYYEGEAYRLRGAEGDSGMAASAYAAAVALPDAPPEAWRAHGYALTKAGQKESGRTALSKYLELKPDAKDAAMIRFSLAQ